MGGGGGAENVPDKLEGEGEGQGEAAVEAGPEMIVTPLARAVISADNLVKTGAQIQVKAELEKYSEAMSTVRPLDDPMVEAAYLAAKEAERARRKGKEVKKKEEGDKHDAKDPKAARGGRKRLLARVEMSVSLNPDKAPAEDDEENA